eukprot:GHVT01011669.1.p1 GENE.GHVT01011669.1~~GHVT01011669.1.p1  ORF type:complete len:163 (+),score=13.08 GHVT01011669.1:173-661(+)
MNIRASFSQTADGFGESIKTVAESQTGNTVDPTTITAFVCRHPRWHRPERNGGCFCRKRYLTRKARRQGRLRDLFIHRTVFLGPRNAQSSQTERVGSDWPQAAEAADRADGRRSQVGGDSRGPPIFSSEHVLAIGLFKRRAPTAVHESNERSRLRRRNLLES